MKPYAISMWRVSTRAEVESVSGVAPQPAWRNSADAIRPRRGYSTLLTFPEHRPCGLQERGVCRAASASSSSSPGRKARPGDRRCPQFPTPVLLGARRKAPRRLRIGDWTLCRTVADLHPGLILRQRLWSRAPSSITGAL